MRCENIWDQFSTNRSGMTGDHDGFNRKLDEELKVEVKKNTKRRKQKEMFWREG